MSHVFTVRWILCVVLRMSWLKKRFSRLRRLAGFKSKSCKTTASSVIATTTTKPTLVHNVPDEAERESSYHRDGAVSASQLTLKLTADDDKRILDGSSEIYAVDREPEKKANAQDEGMLQKQTKYPCVKTVVVNDGNANCDDRMTPLDNTNTKEAMVKQRTNVSVPKQMTKLPVKVSKQTPAPLPPAAPTTTSTAIVANNAGTFTKLATAGERWASQPSVTQTGSVCKQPQPGGKLPRLDRVRPTTDSSEL